MLSVRIWRHFDLLLLASVALLTIAGVAMIRSATAGNEELAEQVVRQAVYAALGLVVVLAVAAVGYRLWSGLSRPIYVGTLGALALIEIAGQGGFGSARWVNVGVVLVQ